MRGRKGSEVQLSVVVTSSSGNTGSRTEVERVSQVLLHLLLFTVVSPRDIVPQLNLANRLAEPVTIVPEAKHC